MKKLGKKVKNKNYKNKLEKLKKNIKILEQLKNWKITNYQKLKN